MKKYIFIVIMLFIVPLMFSCALFSKKPPEEKEGMVVVPKGTFTMGVDTGEVNARSAHNVFLDTFMIDKYEVSARDFAGFLNVRGNSDDQYFTLDKYSTITGITYIQGNAVETEEKPQSYAPRKGFENFPANNVSWIGAFAYCQWKGKRLPTEAEWEKAARDDDERMYPWGFSLPDASKARYGRKWKEEGLNVMVPVDSLPAGSSYYKVFNMAGNVWEWVDDWFKRDYCLHCPENGKCITCQEGGPCEYCPEERPVSGHYKVLRGGSWYEIPGESTIRSTYRYWLNPADRFVNTGFRCAK